jgi:hypothetical protein
MWLRGIRIHPSTTRYPNAINDDVQVRYISVCFLAYFGVVFDDRNDSHGPTVLST